MAMLFEYITDSKNKANEHNDLVHVSKETKMIYRRLNVNRYLERNRNGKDMSDKYDRYR